MNNFKLEIGQAAVGGIPVGDAMLIFKTDDNFLHINFKDFKKCIDTIYDSKGNRSEKSYKAKAQLDRWLNEFVNMIVNSK